MKWIALAIAAVIVYLMYAQGKITVQNDNSGFGIRIRRELPTFNPWSKKDNVNAMSIQASASNVQTSAEFRPNIISITGSLPASRSDGAPWTRGIVAK